MILLQRWGNVLFGSAWVGLLAVLLAVNSAQGANYRWTGAIDSDLTTPGNWQILNADGVTWDPTTAVPGAADEVDFTAYDSPTVQPTIAGYIQTGYFQIYDPTTYPANPAPGRTFTGPGEIIISDNRNIDTVNATSATTFSNGMLTMYRRSNLYAGSSNNSTAADLIINVTTFNVGFGGGTGNVAFNAVGANLTVNSAVDFSLATANRALNLNPSAGRTVTIAGDIIPGTRLTSININAGWDGTTGGTVRMSAIPSASGKAVNVWDGNLEVSPAYPSGGAWTQVMGGNSGNTSEYHGAKILIGGVNDAGALFLSGRTDTNTDPQLRSVSGNNTYSGQIYSDQGGRAGGTNMRISSEGTGAGNFLTITGNIDLNYSGYYAGTLTPTGVGTLYFQGEGDGLSSGGITESLPGAWVWNVAKTGNGTWTLSGANAYSGNTTVNGGKLVLSGSATLGSGPIIDVQNGELDVAGLAGGMTLGGTQTLKGAGTVKGAIATSSGSVIAPGNGGTGTLSFGGSLTLVNGTVMQYELTNTPLGFNDQIAITGNLALSGITTINVTQLDNSLGIGSYRLFDFTGSLIGNASNINIPGITGGLTRTPIALQTPNDGGPAHQINLVVSSGGGAQSYAWKNGVANYDWKIGATGGNNWTSTDQKFYNADSVTFDNTGSNASNINLAATLIPASITFTNDTGHDYTFAGSGAIVAPTSLLTMSGTGKATFANGAANVFSGAALTSGTLAFNQSVNASLALVSGGGELQQNGSNVLTLTGDTSSYYGTITVNSGTIKLGTSGACGSFGDIVVNSGGTLDLNARNVGIYRTVHVQGAGVGGLGAIISANTVDAPPATSMGTLVLDGDATISAGSTTGYAGGYWYTAALDGQVHALTKIGDYEFGILNGETNLSDVNIAAGTFYIWNDTALGDANPGAIHLSNGGVLGLIQSTVAIAKPIVVDATGGGVFWYRSIAGTPQYLNSPITLGGDLQFVTRQFSGNNNTYTLTGKITGPGGLAFSATGSKAYHIYLTSDENDYAGNTVLWSAANLWIGDGGATGKLGAGEVVLNGTTAANRTRLHFNRSGELTVNNLISGGGIVNFDHVDGVVTLANANTFTGGANLNAGTLKLTNALAVQNSTLTLAATAVSIDVAGVAGGSVTLGALAGELNFDLSGNSLTTGGNNASTTYSGMLSNCPILNKAGAGEMDFTGSGLAADVGNVNVQAGSLYFVNAASLGNPAAAVTVAPASYLGVYDNDGAIVHTKPIVFIAGTDDSGLDSWRGVNRIDSNIALNKDISIYTEQGSLLTLGGILSGDFGITKTKTDETGGTVVLDGANTYKGATVIASGKLILTAAGQISPLSPITNNAIFQIDGGAKTLSAIDGAGATYVLGSSAVTTPSIVQDGLQIGGAAPAAAAVPEPSVWLLLAVGGLFAAFLRKYNG